MKSTDNPNKGEFSSLLRIIGLVLLPLFLTLIAGCASVDPDQTFQDVKAEAEERTGRQVHWYQGTAEDQKVEEEVNRMLQEELDVNRAVQIALLNNRRLQATYQELGIAQADLVRAGLLTNPVFEGVMQFDEGAQPTVDLGLTTEFISILMIPLRKKVAQAELERTKMHVTGRIMDLAHRVATEFYRHQANLQIQEMRQGVLDTSEASYQMAQRIHEAGNMTDLELYRQREMYEQAKLDLSSAELAIAETRERLNTLMGLWGNETSWKINSQLPEIPEEPIPMEEMEKKAITKSLDLRMARQKVEAAANKSGISNVTSILPELEAGVEAEGEPSGHWQVGPAVSFPIPLFNQGQPARAAASARLRRAWENYTATAIEVRSTVRIASQRLQVARQRSIYYRDVILPLQKKIMNQTQRRYNGMFVGVFQLLQAKQQEIEARRRYIKELRNYWIARAELRQILNGRKIEDSGVSVSAGAGMESMAGGH